MIRRTYYEKSIIDSFSTISERIVLDSDLDVFNFVLPKQELIQARFAKVNRTGYVLKFYRGELGHINVYLSVIRKNRSTYYYIMNVSYNKIFSDLYDFIASFCIIGQGSKSIYLERLKLDL